MAAIIDGLAIFRDRYQCQLRYQLPAFPPSHTKQLHLLNLIFASKRKPPLHLSVGEPSDGLHNLGHVGMRHLVSTYSALLENYWKKSSKSCVDKAGSYVSFQVRWVPKGDTPQIIWDILWWSEVFYSIHKTPIGVIFTLLSLLLVYKIWLAIQYVHEKIVSSQPCWWAFRYTGYDAMKNVTG
jgi:hypothetical protein